MTPANGSYRLGAASDGAGTTFVVASTFATAVDLCLIDIEVGHDGRERRAERRIPATRVATHHDDIWVCRVDGVGPGQRYGYRAYGPWAPEQGHFFNPAKLLVDPYAIRIENGIGDARSMRSGRRSTDRTLNSDPTDSLHDAPLGIVTTGSPPRDSTSARPRIEWEQTVIYEAHVRGMTMTHPGVPEEQRGTYLGLASDPVLDHLRSLGVTTIELLPVHHSATEPFLVERGLTNYWGYSTVGYFAPSARFAVEDADTEFAEMVDRFHDAGIEVILDVVYNHTAEGGPGGPTMSFRGLDNAVYYRTDPTHRAHYIDVTGTGNTLDTSSPRVVALIADSLRHWVTRYGVDGFRFDLASALIRDGACNIDRDHPLLAVIRQDPVLNDVKLIAEPWDVGLGGYLVGGFPRGWSEWNGSYRDTVRDYWRGMPGQLAHFASRMTGSADLYEHSGRTPGASINFVTAHDGFTLADLVAHNEPHNEANGESNRDGERHNRSWNSGSEGPTDDPDIVLRRSRRQRAMLATLALSRGVPMMTAGDELARTQGGNNNAYCLDNDTSWLDWANPDQDLIGFTQRALAVRRDNLVLRRDRFFRGLIIVDDHADPADSDISWFHPDGRPMTNDLWHSGVDHRLVAVMTPDFATLPDDDGRSTPASPSPASFHVVMATNATDEPMIIETSAFGLNGRWSVLLDSDPLGAATAGRNRDQIMVAPWSLVVVDGPHDA